MALMSQKTADQADQIAQKHADAIDSIMSNSELTLDAKQRAAAKAHVASTNEMDTLRNTVTDGQNVSAQTLAKQLFGGGQATGADAISLRDARDRASQLQSPDDAQQLLADAEMLGDDHLARAVAQRAYGMARSDLGGEAWIKVLDTFAATRPGAEQQINELAELQNQTPQAHIWNAMRFSVPKPAILEGYHDHQIAGLAGGDQ